MHAQASASSAQVESHGYCAMTSSSGVPGGAFNHSMYCWCVMAHVSSGCSNAHLRKATTSDLRSLQHKCGWAGKERGRQAGLTQRPQRVAALTAAQADWQARDEQAGSVKRPHRVAGLTATCEVGQAKHEAVVKRRAGALFASPMLQRAAMFTVHRRPQHGKAQHGTAQHSTAQQSGQSAAFTSAPGSVRAR